MKSDTTPFVTVIVPMYNERGHIGQCLDTLIKSDYPVDHFEVLVLDGGSDDGSRDLVAEIAREADFIRLLDNPRGSAAAGMNIGIQNSRGEVIILLSAHSYVAEDFISQNVLQLNNTGADCVGGPICSVSSSLMGQTIALAMSSPFGVGNALFRYSHVERYVDTLAFGAYRRQVFEDIGLFDEELVYNEDEEFNYRLRSRGGRLLLTPAIRSYYHTRMSLGQLCRQYFNYGFGKPRVLARHPESIMLRHLVPFAFVSTLAVSGLLGLFMPVFLRLLILVLTGYLAASLLFSMIVSAKHGWQHLPLLPLAFGSLHASYGLGFAFGLVWQLGGQARRLLARNPLRYEQG